MDIIFVELSGERILLNNVNSYDFIGDLKKKMIDKTGVPVEKQRFLYCGQELSDDSTVEECGLQEESFVHFVELEDKKNINKLSKDERNDHSTNTSKINVLKKTLCEQEEEIKILKTDIFDYKAENNELIKKKGQLECRVERLLDDNDHLNYTLTCSDANCDSKNRELEKKNTEISKLKETIDDLNKKMFDQNIKMSRLLSEKSEQSKTEEIMMISKNTEKISDKFSEKMKELKDSHDSEKKRLDKLIKKFKKMAESYQEENRQLIKDKTKLLDKVDCFNDKFETLIDEKSDLLEKYNNSVQKNVELAAEIENLKRKPTRFIKRYFGN